jgi:hypothetical protein
MVHLNRAQRCALLRIYKRRPIMVREPAGTCLPARPQTYREFRKTVQGGSGCVMVHWMGMWLDIEPDGYVHS